jgi:hypothetical protein
MTCITQMADDARGAGLQVGQGNWSLGFLYFAGVLKKLAQILRARIQHQILNLSPA